MGFSPNSRFFFKIKIKNKIKIGNVKKTRRGGFQKVYKSQAAILNEI